MDIANFEEVWEWVENVLVEALYPGGKYNDDEFSAREVGTVMTYNRVVCASQTGTPAACPSALLNHTCKDPPPPCTPSALVLV